MSREEFYFQWHFMNTCNLRCAHCYQESYHFPGLELSDLLRIANEISFTLNKWNMYGRISLTGGEPFMSPYLFDLLDYFERDEHTKQLDILTNGTCIDENSINRLKAYKKLRQIQISLDGASRAVHDAVRGDGVYDKVIETIHKLRENNIEVSLMFTLMRQNMNEAVQVIDFAEAHGVNAVTVERVTPCGNSSIKDILNAGEVREIYNAIAIRANKVNFNLTVRRLRPLWIHTEDLNRRADGKIGGFCPVGFTSMAILWDGTVLPCRRLNIPIGNVLKEKLFRIWYGSDVLWRIRDKNNLRGKCHNCQNINRCGGCRAIAYETTGDYMGEDIQCWI
ncbi:MAG: radical SAM protein [Dysgonamonadaceae bacterium]|jgi:radical SAM protein with 4Fe4S-binding SPASM domain|nr:radical SAM protein [Dysgonamonadaceae bacterium]